MDIKYPEANLEVKSLTHWLGVRRMDTDLSTPYLGKSTTAKTTLLCYAAISHGYAVFLHTFGNTVCHGDRRPINQGMIIQRDSARIMYNTYYYLLCIVLSYYLPCIIYYVRVYICTGWYTRYSMYECTYVLVHSYVELQRR